MNLTIFIVIWCAIGATAFYCRGLFLIGNETGKMWNRFRDIETIGDCFNWAITWLNPSAYAWETIMFIAGLIYHISTFKIRNKQ